MIEISLENGSDFLKIRETLSRMGIANKKKKHLSQTSHIIVSDDKKYFIAHYKELLSESLGIDSIMSDNDYKRLRVIVKLLVEWGMCKVADGTVIDENENISLGVISYKEKSEWKIEKKFGNKIKKYTGV